MEAEETLQHDGNGTRRRVGPINRTMPVEPTTSTTKKAASVHRRKATHAVTEPPLNPSDLMRSILTEDLFLGMLCLERKRAERSGKKLLLLLIETEDVGAPAHKAQILKGVVEAADAARRETDPAGWYKQNSIVGIIFTEHGTLDETVICNTLLTKIQMALATRLSPEDLGAVRVSLHIFAEDSDEEGPHISENPAFYPDLFHLQNSKKTSLMVKRFMDVVGSLVALVLFSPVCLALAVIIKLTSKGPVFFKQERLGQFGKKFTCLKFRSMHVNNDLKIHQEFMKRVINGDHDGHAAGGAKPVYKMTDDPRITRIGRFLRRTSLDELPQFINVLRGEMSMVGPRPPLAYEYEEYDVWHRRRVLEIKPGITGLWQVKGRSRVRFDDMVRLDLQYARGWSLWLDIQILIETPRVVIFGDGAF